MLAGGCWRVGAGEGCCRHRWWEVQPGSQAARQVHGRGSATRSWGLGAICPCCSRIPRAHMPAPAAPSSTRLPPCLTRPPPLPSPLPIPPAWRSMRRFWSVVLPFTFASPLGLFVGYVISDIAKGVGAASISALASGALARIALPGPARPPACLPGPARPPACLPAWLPACLPGCELLPAAQPCASPPWPCPVLRPPSQGRYSGTAATVFPTFLLSTCRHLFVCGFHGSDPQRAEGALPHAPQAGSPAGGLCPHERAGDLGMRRQWRRRLAGWLAGWLVRACARWLAGQPWPPGSQSAGRLQLATPDAHTLYTNTLHHNHPQFRHHHIHTHCRWGQPRLAPRPSPTSAVLSASYYGAVGLAAAAAAQCDALCVCCSSSPPAVGC